MTGLALVYKEPLDDVRWPFMFDIYWARFEAWPTERFLDAVNRHLNTCKYFPKPSELLELGRPTPLAWKPIAFLPKQDETPEDRHAREQAMAAMRKFLESGPSMTRGRC